MRRSRQEDTSGINLKGDPGQRPRCNLFHMFEGQREDQCGWSKVSKGGVCRDDISMGGSGQLMESFDFSLYMIPLRSQASISPPLESVTP